MLSTLILFFVDYFMMIQSQCYVELFRDDAYVDSFGSWSNSCQYNNDCGGDWNDEVTSIRLFNRGTTGYCSVEMFQDDNFYNGIDRDYEDMGFFLANVPPNTYCGVSNLGLEYKYDGSPYNFNDKMSSFKIYASSINGEKMWCNPYVDGPSCNSYPDSDCHILSLSLGGVNQWYEH